MILLSSLICSGKYTGMHGFSGTVIMANGNQFQDFYDQIMGFMRMMLISVVLECIMFYGYQSSTSYSYQLFWHSRGCNMERTIRNDYSMTLFGRAVLETANVLHYFDQL